MNSRVLFRRSILIISLILITAAATAADEPFQRPKDRAAISVSHAPIYGLSGTELGVFAGKAGASTSLGAMATNAVGMEISTTAYDYQHNGSMGHQVEHRGTNYLHFDWMDQPDFVIPGDRGIGVQSFDLTGCAYSFDPGGKRATTDYAGYVNIDADQNGCAIPVGHEGDPLEPRAYWDFCAGAPAGLFSADAPTDIYGWYNNNGTGPDNENIWPICDWQIGTETVLHMVFTETGSAAGDAQTVSYYRRVGAYGTGNGAWSLQRLIDTVMNITAVVTSSVTSDKVAIVWGAPTDEVRDTPDEFASQYRNDVWYAVASDQGASWVTDQANGSIGHEVDIGSVSGQNITQFPLDSDFNFYVDLAALITTDDNLHVVFACREWDVTSSDTLLFRRNSVIYHWSENVPDLRQVARADWDTGGTCYGHAWGGDLAKVSISECDGKLYCLYTQFGNENAPCEDKSDEDYMNGELYLSVSPNGGQGWDEGQNLTTTETPGCAPGDCESDYWASMARFGRTQAVDCPDQGLVSGEKYLDILYINDRHAGGVVQEEGQWTTNPVMWLATPCREANVAPIVNDDAGDGYGICYEDDFWGLVPEGQSTTRVLTIWNNGLADVDYTISFNYDAPYSNWMSIIGGSANGTLPGLGGEVQTEFQFSDPGVTQVPTTVYGEIFIDYSDYVDRTIPVCLYIYDQPPPPPGSTILSTACKDLRVYNNGQLSNDANGSAMDFNIDCDTLNTQTTSDIYLYDGGPLIGRVNGSDTMVYRTYANTWFDTDVLRPTQVISEDDSHSEYTVVYSEAVTADSSLGLVVTYYVPTAPESCDFILVKEQLYNNSEVALNGVAFGEFIDWDVPSDSGSNNGSGFDLNKKLHYQFGGEYNQDDSTEALCPQESDDRYGGMFILDDDPFVPKNIGTVDNPTWVYTIGPYGSEAPLPDGPVYEKMVTDDGYYAWTSNDPESLYVDLSTLVTFGVYDMAVDDTIEVWFALITTKDYYSGYWDDADSLIEAFHDCVVNANCGGDCCDTAGDANNDDNVNVGDAVFIINYVFSGGPEPPCMQEADSNGDGEVNIGDAIYDILFVFSGGPPPICGP